MKKLFSQSSRLSRKHERETSSGNAEGKLPGGRLIRRLTLADPARLATKPVHYEYVCAAAPLLRDRHIVPQGRSVKITDGGTGGCAKRNRSEAKHKRKRLSGQEGTFGLSVASFADSFLMRIRQRTPSEGRQGGQSSSLATPLLSSASLAPAIVHRRIQGPRTIAGGFVAAHASCRRLFPSVLPSPPSA